MRRATAWVVVVGVAMFGAGTVRADDGFWVSLASGVAGASTPSNYEEFWFETPHGPAPVALTQLGGTSVQATTGGGSSFFNSGALPAVLNTTNGYGYLAGGTPPSDLSSALKRQIAGGGLASATPSTAAALPTDANRLSVSESAPNASGVSTLSISLTDPNGKSLGSTSVSVPSGGWWVLGLGPGTNDGTTTPTPVPVPAPPPTTTPTPVPVPAPPSGVATPEPATILLVGIGGLGACGWQFCRRRRVV